MKLSLKIKRASYFYESLIIIADSLHNDYANITRNAPSSAQFSLAIASTRRRNAQQHNQRERLKRSPARYTSATHRPCRLQYS